MTSENLSDRENPIGDYLLNDELGSGGFAKVVQAIHIPTGEKVAVKIMDKAQIFSEPLNLNRIQREIAILKIVRHKNIIKLYELMETPNKIYLVMEYCNGGELFDYIVSKQHLSERQACRFFQEIINSIEYLHSLNIVHRDLKPENLLLDKINNKITLKLIDFGISNCYSPDKLLNTPCGTASYAPPEMHKGEEYYGLLSDVWSAGVVLYAMVFGYLPFCEDDEDTNINNIIEGNYEIPEEASPELADLLIHLLDINPLTRYDLEQIKQHPWFNMVKTYKYIPGVIEGFHRIPVDMKIVEACEQYGYDKERVIDSVENCKYNRNSSVYYILLSKMKREGYHSISDLCSDEFLRYIKDRKNIIYKTEENIMSILGDEENNNNNIENEVYINNTLDENTEGNNNNKNARDKISNNNKKIVRHQSHPLGGNNFNINDDDSLYEFTEEKNKKVNNEPKKDNKEEKAKELTNENNNNTNMNTNSNEDKKIPKNQDKKENKENKESIEIKENKDNIENKENKEVKTPACKNPKAKEKKNRNEKRNQIDNINKYNQIMNNMTLTASNQSNNKTVMNNSKKKKINKKEKNNDKEKDNNKKKNNNNNNRSFSQTRKTKPKKEKGKEKEKKDNNIKNIYPKISKKSENNTLKTEIIRKSINNNKMMPMCSFNIMSKTKEKLNGINNNEVIDIDFMNTSFTKKLSDDIKEKILKLKNPKQKISEKEKEKKLNNALLSLKMKKQRKKGNDNNKQNKKSKKTKIGVRLPIFQNNSRKDHTIIHNRNASLIVDNKNKKLRNLSAEKNKNKKDISFSPNIGHDKRNIINIYVHNKNNINSNNVYNINFITKGHYSVEKRNTNKKRNHNNNNNTNNSKTKKNKNNQNNRAIEPNPNMSVNSNNYLNTTNISFSNRNRKNAFQTPIKCMENMYMEKGNKILIDYIQNQPNNNNNQRNANRKKGHAKKSHSIENRFFKNPYLYNNSFNELYNNNENNKKKIKIDFKPIKEKEFDYLNNSKKIRMDKVNSNRKIQKIESLTNNKKKNNNKVYHYKSRSMMDNDNTITHKNNRNNISIYNNNNNYTITENKKVTNRKIRPIASAGEINKTNNNISYNTKQRKKLINISFINLHTNDINKHLAEPRKYKGPVDLTCLLVCKTINLLIEKITHLLKRNKITVISLNPYKLKCSKNGESFDIEILGLNYNLIKLNDNNNNNINSTFYESNIKDKIINEKNHKNNFNLYYYSLISRGTKSKSLGNAINKLISSRLGILRMKKV